MRKSTKSILWLSFVKINHWCNKRDLETPKTSQCIFQRGREREREREIGRDRQTDRHTDTQTDTQTDIQTHRHTEWQTDRQAGRQIEKLRFYVYFNFIISHIFSKTLVEILQFLRKYEDMFLQYHSFSSIFQFFFTLTCFHLTKKLMTSPYNKWHQQILMLDY